MQVIESWSLGEKPTLVEKYYAIAIDRTEESFPGFERTLDLTELWR